MKLDSEVDLEVSATFGTAPDDGVIDNDRKHEQELEERTVPPELVHMPMGLKRKRRIERIEELRQKTDSPTPSTVIERCRSITILDLDPADIIDDLVRVRVVPRDTRDEIMALPTREKQAGALVDFLADQPSSRVLRPYTKVLKDKNPFLYALLNIGEKQNAFTARITEVNLSALSSLRGNPVLEDPEMERRASMPSMHIARKKSTVTPPSFH